MERFFFESAIDEDADDLGEIYITSKLLQDK